MSPHFPHIGKGSTQPAVGLGVVNLTSALFAGDLTKNKVSMPVNVGTEKRLR